MDAAEPPVVEELGADHAAAAVALVDGAGVDERFRELLRDWIDEARDEKGERRGLVARIGDRVVGLAIHASVAGTQATGALHALLVGEQHRRQGIGSALLAASRVALRDPDVIVAELPAGAAGGYESFLRARGFDEVGRVADYFADGLPLLILTARRASTDDGPAVGPGRPPLPGEAR